MSDSDTEDELSHCLHSSPLRVSGLSDFGSVSPTPIKTIGESNVDVRHCLVEESDAIIHEKLSGDEAEDVADSSGQRLPVGAAFAVARSRKLSNFLPL